MTVGYFEERKYLKEGFKKALVSLHLYRLDRKPGELSAEPKRRKANLQHYNDTYNSLRETHKIKFLNRYLKPKHLERIFRSVIRTSGFGNPWERKYAHLLAENLKLGYMTTWDFAVIMGELNQEGDKAK